MARNTLSDFYTVVGQDSELSARFLKAVDGKHSGEAIVAISRFAESIGFKIALEDLTAAHRKTARHQQGLSIP